MRRRTFLAFIKCDGLACDITIDGKGREKRTPKSTRVAILLSLESYNKEREQLPGL